MAFTLAQKMVIIAEAIIVGLLLSCVVMFIAISASCLYDLDWYVPSLFVVSMLSLFLSISLLGILMWMGSTNKFQVGILLVASAVSALFSGIIYNAYTSDKQDPNATTTGLTMTPVSFILILICCYVLRVRFFCMQRVVNQGVYAPEM